MAGLQRSLQLALRSAQHVRAKSAPIVSAAAASGLAQRGVDRDMAGAALPSRECVRLSEGIRPEARMSGAGVLLFDLSSRPSLVLFRDRERLSWSEPGGFLKGDAPSSEASAAQELFEESCGLVRASDFEFLPFVVDINGRSSKTFYRAYFAALRAPTRLSMRAYSQARCSLVESKFSRDFLETDALTHVPLVNVLNGVYESAAGFIVTDASNQLIPLSRRTAKVLRTGGMSLLREIAQQFDPSVARDLDLVP